MVYLDTLIRLCAYSIGGREIGSSQKKSPHQARAFRRGLDVYVLIQIFLLNDKLVSPVAMKRIGESAIWADLTIRLAMKANIMSARIDLMAYGEGPGVEYVAKMLSEVCVGSLLKE